MCFTGHEAAKAVRAHSQDSQNDGSPISLLLPYPLFSAVAQRLFLIVNVVQLAKMQYGGMSQGYPTAPSYMYAPSGPQNPGLYAQPVGAAPYQLTRPQNSRYGSMREFPVTNPYASPAGALMPIPGESHGRRGRQRPANHRSDSDPAKKPLKSAMKKPKRSEHVLPNGGPHRSQTMPAMEEIGRFRSRHSEVGHDDELARTRTISDPNRGRANQFSRPRTRSQAEHHYTPSMYQPNCA